MVFEAIVVEVLNRFLGEYVENLDASQLKIGIWGGDVVLKNLALKQTALNELNLPIKVTWGKLGKLVLKIPWKNLYSAPVIVNIEDLFVLVAPESDITYVPEREERWAQEAKAAELLRVEEAKKRAAEIDAVKADDTFVEKLVTQIIKNVQVQVERIHVRYEDRSTRKGAPGSQGTFCVGVTLNKLIVNTTDQYGVPCFAAETVLFIYKSLVLDGLALYWNPSGELLSELPLEERLHRFKSDIPTCDYQPPDYSFMFGPISSSAKLILNSKPETDGTNYTTAKLQLSITMDEFAIALTRRQFSDMMLLVENMNHLSNGRPYRKYRPAVNSYHGHYREWWKFAIECVMVDVKRRKNDWDWIHMKLHRQRCRDYQGCYARILCPNPPPELVKQARELEKELDVLNLILVRERAAMDAQRMAREQEEARASRGWFSGWFRSQPTAEEQFSTAIAKKIETALTGDEKSKLYEAIGYQENTVPTIYPVTFVATRLSFELVAVRVRILDEGLLVLRGELNDLSVQLEQRPAANALRASLSFGEFTVIGVEQPAGVPQLVRSSCDGDVRLVDAVYETNPLDGRCDQRIHVKARPLLIVYNHETVTRLQDIFTSVDTSGINKVKARTAASLPTFKQMSSMGLQFALERRSRLDVQIQVSSSTILVPHLGVFLSDRAMLIIKLGQLSVETEEQKAASDVTVKKLYQQGISEDEIFTSILSESYTKFNCRLSGVQVLMRLEKEEWESSLVSKSATSLHLLQPTDLQVVVKKSVVTEDARIPKMLVEGVLPSICVQVTEERILALAALIFSITQTPPGSKTEGAFSSTWSLSSLSSHLEHKSKEKPAPVKPSPDTALVQGTDLICRFTMNELVVHVSRMTGRFLSLEVVKLEVNFVQKTLETVLDVQLKDVAVTQQHDSLDIPILKTAGGLENQCLALLNVTSCERTSPELYTTRGGVLTLVQFRVSRSNFVLHRASLVALMDFADNLSKKIEQVKKNESGAEVLQGEVPLTTEFRRLSLILEEDAPQKKRVVRSRKAKKSSRGELIELKADIVVECVGLEVRDASPIAKLTVEGIKLGVIGMKTCTEYTIALQGLQVKDLDPATAYSMVAVSAARETMRAEISMFNKELLEASGEFEVDMQVRAELGQVRLVYLQRFLTQLVEFGNSFQTAKEAVLEASAAAAERAKQNMMKAYDDATKLSLKVHIVAPVIVVPRNRQCLDTIVIDLGVVNISNFFTNLKPCDQGTPVLDTMRLDLQELKLVRAAVNPENLDVVVEHPLLDPVTFNMEINRNLSVAWYHKVPDLELSSRLGSICLSLDKMDYAFAMSILSENIGDDNSSAKKGSAPLESTPADREVSAGAPSVHTAIMFTFSMENFIISLHPGGYSTLTANDRPEPRKHGLARFVLQTMALKGKMLSNGSICTSIILVDCLLEDTRSGKESRLTTLMERKTEDRDTSNSMIDVTYEQTGLHRFLDVRVSSFSLILSVDLLMKIAMFFQIENQAELVRPVRQGRRGRKMTEKPNQLPEPPPSNPDEKLTFKLRIEKPDIVLVETMEDINSDALVFHTEVTLNYRTVGSRQIISGVLKNLELYSCCFNLKKRAETMKQVIKPVTVSLAGSTPEGEGLHLDLCFTAIAIAVSPSTIHLMSQCYAALDLAPDGQKQEESDWSNVWNQKKFEEHDYWFLMPDEAFDAFEALEALNSVPSPRAQKEVCMLDLPSMLVTIEAGVGNHTVPMILLEMRLSGEIRNWSSGLQLESNLSLGMQYYNTNLSAWEPFIEPVEVPRGYHSEFHPWEICCQVTKNILGEDSTDIAKPEMTITLEARDTLEMTVTRSCLDMLTQLGEAFSNAVSTVPAIAPVGAPSAAASYVVRNDSGLAVVLLLADSKLKVGGNQTDNVHLESGEHVELSYPVMVATDAPARISYTPSSPSGAVPGSLLILQLPDINKATMQVSLDGAGKRLYPVPAPTGSPIDAGQWAIVAEVSAATTFTTVTLRSSVQIHNHFSVSMDIHYMINQGNEVENIGFVEPYGTLNLPLYAICTRTGELFFSVEGYSLSTTPFVWKKLQNDPNVSMQLLCESKMKEDVDPFFIRAVGELEQAFWENTTKRTLGSMCFNIHLLPTLQLVNGLPTGVNLTGQGGVKEIYVKPGARAQAPHVNPGSSSITLRISDYLEKEWSCRYNIPSSTPPEFSVLSFESFDSAAPVTLNLGIHCTTARDSVTIELYCPFWMINKTGRQLSYKLDDATPVMYHPASYLDPIMLSPNSRKFLGKKKGQVKVEQGDWSDKFSLDVAGSSGMVECRSEGKTEVLSVMVQLTHSSLTKMIIFTPAYVVVNKTQTVLDVKEFGSSSWMKVVPEGCAPLWPLRGRDSLLVARVNGTNEETPSFSFHSTHSCLLWLHNKYGGIFCNVQNTAAGIYIYLYPYEPGHAPALLLNHSDHPILFKEEGRECHISLPPGHSLLYSWQQPAGKKEVECITNHGNIKLSLNQDASGKFGKSELFYLSFLDGLQRVLLVTHEERVVRAAQSAALEKSTLEISFNLHGLGLSVVNNRPPKSVELLHMGMVSSGVFWETCKVGARRWKAMPKRESGLIESAYTKYKNDQQLDRKPDPLVVIDNKLHVNLDTFQLVAPNNRILRRTFEPGLWVKYTQSLHSNMIHGKINRLQLDNQTNAAIFPVILAPVPPPKTVAADQGTKPFVEVSILKRLTTNSTVQQYKLFQVLIQEFHIKLDVGFVNALLTFLEAEDTPEVVTRNRFLTDVQLSRQPLITHIVDKSSQEHKDFYDLLHFSPLKIHLSFSMASNVDSKSLPAAFSLLLQSLGVTLTDIQDAVFRLSYLERKNLFLTRSQLIGEAQTHYSGQALRQVYVLLLGLDVIGNPYGLVTGIGEGVEALFYEPFQGMIQGPSEFAEGLGLGIKSIFGHTVGGAAGAFGRITGTLGKGLAALTMDKEYQQQRLDQQNRRPENLHTAMAQGGRGLVMGVFDGVSGVVTKPIAGARKEGVGGFFKGMGKGVVGLVTRPVTGVVDFASSSLNVVKRATDNETETGRLRPPRLLRGTTLEPYRVHAAAGNTLLAQLDGRRYTATDDYEFHVKLNNGDVLILTDKRLIVASLSDVFGTWQINLTLRWSELTCAPTALPKGILLSVEHKDKKLLPIANAVEQQLLSTLMGKLFQNEKSIR